MKLKRYAKTTVAFLTKCLTLSCLAFCAGASETNVFRRHLDEFTGRQTDSLQFALTNLSSGETLSMSFSRLVRPGQSTNFGLALILRNTNAPFGIADREAVWFKADPRVFSLTPLSTPRIRVGEFPFADIATFELHPHHFTTFAFTTNLKVRLRGADRNFEADIPSNRIGDLKLFNKTFVP